MNIGFSSGALRRGDFRAALSLLRPYHLSCVELSALRLAEVQALLEAIPSLDLDGYSYISFHAPSSFSAQEEPRLAELLYRYVPVEWPIVLHPDVVTDWNCWLPFGKRIAVENMDRRKATGRSVRELDLIFKSLPEASLCFDLGHSRQCDASMTWAYLILQEFRSRLVQIHLSEVNSASQHDRLSYGSIAAFRQVARFIPVNIPVILESRVSDADLSAELQHAQQSLTPLRKRSEDWGRSFAYAEC
jgi:hypothetical protein